MYEHFICFLRWIFISKTMKTILWIVQNRSKVKDLDFRHRSHIQQFQTTFNVQWKQSNGLLFPRRFNLFGKYRLSGGLTTYINKRISSKVSTRFGMLWTKIFDQSRITDLFRILVYLWLNNVNKVVLNRWAEGVKQLKIFNSKGTAYFMFLRHLRYWSI